MEKNPYVQREALRKVLSRLKKYRVLIALSILFAAVTVALTLYVPVLVGDTIDMIVGPGDVNFTGIAASRICISSWASFSPFSRTAAGFFFLCLGVSEL